eukprot:1805007-Pleurochrysis_carterae.AAC.1
MRLHVVEYWGAGDGVARTPRAPATRAGVAAAELGAYPMECAEQLAAPPPPPEPPPARASSDMLGGGRRGRDSDSLITRHRTARPVGLSGRPAGPDGGGSGGTDGGPRATYGADAHQTAGLTSRLVGRADGAAGGQGCPGGGAPFPEPG